MENGPSSTHHRERPTTGRAESHRDGIRNWLYPLQLPILLPQILEIGFGAQRLPGRQVDQVAGQVFAGVAMDALCL